jgi:nucleotide-binding universal stress UspA family protein
MRILMAIGGLPHSEPTVRFGALIAARSGSAPTLLAVVKHARDRADAESELVRAGWLIPPEVGDAVRRVRVGHPAEEIIREAEEGHYDLVLVGDKQHRGLMTRFLLGSTAQRVVEHAPCPVVIAKGRAVRLHRVLLCDSGAASPPLTVRFAEQLGAMIAPDDEVTVLHVMSQIAAGRGVDEGPLAADADDLIAQHQPEGDLFERDVRQLEHLHVRSRPKVRHGAVVDEILAEAGEGDYDLVVIGAFRGEGWRRVLLDDLAHEIIVRMDRSILVVR